MHCSMERDMIAIDNTGGDATKKDLKRNIDHILDTIYSSTGVHPKILASVSAAFLLTFLFYFFSWDSLQIIYSPLCCEPYSTEQYPIFASHATDWPKYTNFSGSEACLEVYFPGPGYIEFPFFIEWSVYEYSTCSFWCSSGCFFMVCSWPVIGMDGVASWGIVLTWTTSQGSPPLMHFYGLYVILVEVLAYEGK